MWMSANARKESHCAEQANRSEGDSRAQKRQERSVSPVALLAPVVAQTSTAPALSIGNTFAIHSLYIEKWEWAHLHSW